MASKIKSVCNFFPSERVILTFLQGKTRFTVFFSVIKTLFGIAFGVKRLLVGVFWQRNTGIHMASKIRILVRILAL